MTKQELSELLHSLEIPVNEGITSAESLNEYPRIVYWPYYERDEVASGESYQNIVTYQISFYARTPQHEKYKELRRRLRNLGLRPAFQHEYVEKDPVFAKTWHTFFALDIVEEIDGVS